MWWRGGAGLTERSERVMLSAVATHDVFAFWCLLAKGMTPYELSLQYAMGWQRFVSGKAPPTTNRASKRGHRHNPIRKQISDEIGHVLGNQSMPLILGDALLVTTQMAMSDRPEKNGGFVVIIADLERTKLLTWSDK